MSTVVFVGQTKPEKGLRQVIKMKAYLSDDQRKEIIEQILQQWPAYKDKIDKYHVTMTVEIELKEYDTKNT